MAIRYFACPACRCRAPGRFFDSEDAVLKFAEQACAHYRVGYTAWRVHVGAWSLLRLFKPEDRADQDPIDDDQYEDPDPTQYEER
jgi:hypothetical protein